MRMIAEQPAGPWLLVEGGGNRTWVAVIGERTAQLSGPTTNIFTSAGSAGIETLEHLLRAVLASAEVPATEVSTVFVAHGAAATDRSAETFADRVVELLATLSVRAPLIVTSDMVPVVTSDPGDAVVAAIAGTGTIYAAHRRLTRWARASGADYLLSDEGGGFDLGMNGLRAAIRATDGRGPMTDLVARARAWAAMPDDVRLSDGLYQHVYVANPRSVVAGFARSVVEAARQGDGGALGLVESAADEVVIGVRAVADRVGIARASPRVVLSGSLATAESPLRRAIVAKLDEHLAPAAITNYQPEEFASKARGLVRLINGEGDRLAGLRTVCPMAIRQAS